MHIEQLSWTVVKIILKTLFFVMIFYLVLNVVCVLYNLPRINAISKLVQDSVHDNGYLPNEDYKSIKAYIDAYTYQARNAESPLNINKVVTNLRIVVYDMSGKGYPTDHQLHSYMEDSDYDDGYVDANDSDTIKGNKVQQGGILFAGVCCDYLILNPLNGWMLFNRITDGTNTEITFDEIASMRGNMYTNVDVPDVIIYDDNETSRPFGYTSINTLEIKNQKDSSSAQASLFINPVYTSKYYPDIEDNVGTGF